MQTNHHPPTDTHASVQSHLAVRAIRYTAGRRAVITAMLRSIGPESAAELQQRLGAPLSSVYRTLTVLDEAGVLVKQHDADGLARFELAEWLQGHHHHLVCIECGTVEDVDVSEEAESGLDALAQRIAEAAGYAVTGHNLEIEGVCRSCRT